jgi:hypothetical protein
VPALRIVGSHASRDQAGGGDAAGDRSMSWRAVRRVFSGAPESCNPTQTLVMVCLADHGDDAGSNIYPSISTIARECHLSPKQARRVVHDLVAADLLELVAGGGGAGVANRYRIAFEKFTPADGSVSIEKNSPTEGSEMLEENPPLDGKGRSEEHSRPGAKTLPPRGQNTPAGGSRTVGTVMNGKNYSPSESCADRIPHVEIRAAFREILPMAIQHRAWNERRQKALRARWHEDPKRQSVDWWTKLFRYVATSEFLTGRANGSGREPFQLSLEWMLKPANLDKIIDGNYHRRHAS